MTFLADMALDVQAGDKRPEPASGLENSIYIVVPPFGSLSRPALGPHVLQACAAQAGFKVSILYANLRFGAQIGESRYEVISHGGLDLLLGERLFAPLAFPGQAAPPDAASLPAALRPAIIDRCNHHLTFADYSALLPLADSWLQSLAAELAAQPQLRVLGASTTFEQTAASLALLRRVKERRPDVVTVLGGANCAAEMADGLADCAPFVDYIISGESEAEFPALLSELAAGRRPAERIRRGAPCYQLDELPTPSFAEYYAQLAACLPDSELVRSGQIWLPYESSRGCWWGAKHHCTFCGLEDATIGFRHKSPDRVLQELATLLPAHPTRLLAMVDNIMPHRYFDTLLPRLAADEFNGHIFYEVKANLTFSQVGRLRKAGVRLIQPGIESLSTPLLQLMDKGITAAQNIALLRYARMHGIAVNWNLLYGFPGDVRRWYEDMLALLPLIPHLEPPQAATGLAIDRFSPYFVTPERYGLKDLKPAAAYATVFPAGSPTERVAYRFVAEYASESRDDAALIGSLHRAVADWWTRYLQEGAAAALLAVAPLGRGRYLLLDSRGLPGQSACEVIDAAQARLVLFGKTARTEDAQTAWAESRQAVVRLDGRWVPLAITDLQTYQEFENTGASTRELRVVST